MILDDNRPTDHKHRRNVAIYIGILGVGSGLIGLVVLFYTYQHPPTPNIWFSLVYGVFSVLSLIAGYKLSINDTKPKFRKRNP